MAEVSLFSTRFNFYEVDTIKRVAKGLSAPRDKGKNYIVTRENS